jgi:hypothetical protein
VPKQKLTAKKTEDFREVFRQFWKKRGFMRKPFSALDFNVIIDFLLPNVTEKFNFIVEKFQLSAPFTLADFQVICDVENIFLTRFEMSDETTLGTYFVSIGGDYQAINIKPGLTEKDKLKAAAHETSHHFLHREAMRSGTVGTSKALAEFPAGLSLEGLTAELEADLLASLLLTYNAEVKNV